jgi:hypothetical protein
MPETYRPKRVNELGAPNLQHVDPDASSRRRLQEANRSPVFMSPESPAFPP